VPPQQVAEHLQEHPHHIEEYMTEIRRGKSLALIVESATVTDSEGNPVELANLREDGTIGDPAAEAELAEVEVEEVAGDVLEGDAATDEAAGDAAEQPRA
jgi:trigger factor